METPWEGLVETAAGPTFIKTLGSGPPLVIVNGGPGFDHSYLLQPLAFLAKRRTLVFFDQPGCGRTPPPAEGPSAAATFRHFRALLDRLKLAAAGVIAHSWGALVVVAAMAEPGFEPTFAEAIFVNPIPVRSADYVTVRDGFARSIPPDRFVEFERLLRSGASGTEAYAVLLPYYFGDRKPLTLPRVEVNAGTYFAVEASLGPFDHSAGLAALPRLGLIRGELDLTPADRIADLVARAERVVSLAGVGHFPYSEAPAEFERAVKGMLAAG